MALTLTYHSETVTCTFSLEDAQYHDIRILTTKLPPGLLGGREMPGEIGAETKALRVLYPQGFKWCFAYPKNGTGHPEIPTVRASSGDSVIARQCRYIPRARGTVDDENQVGRGGILCLDVPREKKTLWIVWGSWSLSSDQVPRLDESLIPWCKILNEKDLAKFGIPEGTSPVTLRSWASRNLVRLFEDVNGGSGLSDSWAPHVLRYLQKQSVDWSSSVSLGENCRIAAVIKETAFLGFSMLELEIKMESRGF